MTDRPTTSRWARGGGYAAAAVRALAIATMSFAVAFGFLAATQAQTHAYDPYSFAIGTAALLGAACGGIGLLADRLRLLRCAMRERVEELRDRNWELAEARDRAEDASRLKSRFIASVTHEFRTPLNGILGMADLLADTPLRPEQSAYLGAIAQSANTLQTLIEQILDFSRIESGRVELDCAPFDLTALIEQTVELLAPRAQAKGIEIEAFVDDRLPAWIAGDQTRVRQVLLNLVGNAVKFTDAGAVSVTAEPGPQPDAVILRVQDTGVGIPPEALPRIFDEFEQAGAARRQEGTGLGLAIARRIVERMGGRIDATSAPGDGATLTVTLPLSASTPHARDTAARPDLSGRDILLVGRHQELLARRLRSWGARVVQHDDATAGSAALGQPWHVLLVDHQQAALAAHARHVPRRIVLTTPAQRHELPALMDAGCTDYLIKPVRALSLAARLNPASEPAGLSVLVAEDSEINALLARALLERLGHRPTLAPDGQAAVAAWRAARDAGTPFDIVLMDLQMPELDGSGAAQCIRAAEAAAPRTPIIALTAGAPAEAGRADMDAVLMKPLDRETLAAALAAAVRRHSRAA